MSRISMLAIAASVVMASSAFASTLVPNQGFHHSVTPGNKAKSVAGIVNPDGSIALGSGYSVSHDDTGEYTIDVPAGYFKDCPVILASPAGYTSEFPIVNDYNYITCGGNGEVKMQIRICGRKTGARQDNAFHFLIID